MKSAVTKQDSLTVIIINKSVDTSSGSNVSHISATRCVNRFVEHPVYFFCHVELMLTSHHI